MSNWKFSFINKLTIILILGTGSVFINDDILHENVAIFYRFFHGECYWCYCYESCEFFIVRSARETEIKFINNVLVYRYSGVLSFYHHVIGDIEKRILVSLTEQMWVNTRKYGKLMQMQMQLMQSGSQILNAVTWFRVLTFSSFYNPSKKWYKWQIIKDGIYDFFTNFELCYSIPETLKFLILPKYTLMTHRHRKRILQ